MHTYIHAYIHTYIHIPYGEKLWRVQTLANWQGKLHWRNKIWQIDYKSLIKRILKQFEDTSAPNLSIHTCVCARMAVLSSVESVIRGYHEYMEQPHTLGEELECNREPGNPDDS